LWTDLKDCRQEKEKEEKMEEEREVKGTVGSFFKNKDGYGDYKVFKYQGVSVDDKSSFLEKLSSSEHFKVFVHNF
jgi:hypothetical protein